MRQVLAAALLCVATPALAQTVEVAGGDWSEIPEVRTVNSKAMGESTLQRIEDLLGPKGSCSTSQKKTIDLRVPFLLQFGQSGNVEHIVIKRTGCRELERVLGGVVMAMVKAGDFRPTGENPENWYRGEINYEIR